MIHLMLEAEANGHDPLAKLEDVVKQAGKMFASQQDEFDEIVGDVRDIMTDYFNHPWEKDKVLKFIKREGRRAEHEFEVDVTPNIVLVGKLDAFATTPYRDKERWIVENKSFRQMPNDDHRWRNLQSNTYIRVNEMLNLPKVAGFCWNYIRTKSPTVPKLLKNGEPSQKRLDTLPTRLTRFFDDRDVDPKTLRRMIDTAKKNEGSYFIRIFTPVKKRVVDLVWRDIVETATIMAEGAWKWRAKTIGRHCEWCEFEPICRAELTGGDVNFIKKKEYYRNGDEDAPIEIG